MAKAGIIVPKNSTSSKPLLAVAEAIQRITAGMRRLPGENLPLANGDILGRVIADDITAGLTHPPADLSAMDGYAVSAADIATASISKPVHLRLMGESAAGSPYHQTLTAGTCVRISTGGAVPAQADAIAILENTAVIGDGQIEVRAPAKPGQFIRRQGQDFAQGDIIATAKTRVTARLLGLLLAAGVNEANLIRQPRIAIITTGSELVAPGTMPDAAQAQIISSNGAMLAAMIRQFGGVPRLLPIVADKMEALLATIADAVSDSDMLVITGGASVGKHDLVAQWMQTQAKLDFYRIAMRPGKPMLFGHIAKPANTSSSPLPVLGLPGNPVSAGVCTLIFVRAAINAMLGLVGDLATEAARVSHSLPANDEREEYMRAVITPPPKGMAVGKHEIWVSPLPSQDSGKLKDFARAQALLIRPGHAPALETGAWVDIIRLDKI